MIQRDLESVSVLKGTQLQNSRVLYVSILTRFLKSNGALSQEFPLLLCSALSFCKVKLKIEKGTSKMSQWVKAAPPQPKPLSSVLRTVWWKEGADPYKLSYDLYPHAGVGRAEVYVLIFFLIEERKSPIPAEGETQLFIYTWID